MPSAHIARFTRLALSGRPAAIRRMRSSPVPKLARSSPVSAPRPISVTRRPAAAAACARASSYCPTAPNAGGIQSQVMMRGEGLKLGRWGAAREAALLSVGYDTLCRSAELASMTVADVEPDAGVIIILRAKNDPFGDGR